MPRQHRRRKIVAPPRFKGYKPYGCRQEQHTPVELLFEEYEAIKLADYKLLNHQEAALLMDVSRATFARIYESARRKIAMALVETKEIITQTGNSYAEKKWFNCGKCQTRFTTTDKNELNGCPRCHNQTIETIVKTK